MRLADGTQLTYCTNIHPGEGWEEVRQQLERHLPAIKARTAPDVPFGVGLRLGARAARELLAGNNLSSFSGWLRQKGLYVFTLNGFPYGDFHHLRVKDRVHRPDWRQEERVVYTRNLIRILAALLPEGLYGSISTSPISYRHWFSPKEQAEARRAAVPQLTGLVRELQQLEETRGKRIQLDLEPEPDGLLENSSELIHFFREELYPKMEPSVLSRYLGICYDVCHFAVAFENHGTALDQLAAAGIRIGKVQVSSALQTSLSGTGSGEDARMVDALGAFEEPTYLHQVVIRDDTGALQKYRDLGPAIEAWKAAPRAGEWRVHFHVPVFVPDYGLLSSTQADIYQLFSALKERDLHPHLEVETYTWEVLPDPLRLDLQASIARELEWTKNAYATDRSA